MNSREIVRRTLEFAYPERVAQSFEPSDLVFSGPEFDNPRGEWRRICGNEWQRVDEWGNVWGRLDETSKGEIVKGALDDLDQVDRFILPDFNAPQLYLNAAQIFSSHPQHWHNAWIHGFAFSAARKLRRMEQYLMDILEERSKIARLHDRIDEQVENQIRRFKEVGADSIMIAEDWGTQTHLLISPRLWRSEFKPRFARQVDLIHSLGMKFFMHSCGKMTDIIPDLIECGVDLLQFDQPRIHGIDLLSQYQKNHSITYWCPVDIQTTLQSENAEIIQADAHEMIDKLWAGRGGFIAGYYTDNASIGLSPEWQEIACRSFAEYGKRDKFGLSGLI